MCVINSLRRAADEDGVDVSNLVKIAVAMQVADAMARQLCFAEDNISRVRAGGTVSKYR